MCTQVDLIEEYVIRAIHCLQKPDVCIKVVVIAEQSRVGGDLVDTEWMDMDTYNPEIIKPYLESGDCTM